MEKCAAARAVVERIDWKRGIVENGVSGTVVPAQHHQVLLAAITRSFRNPELCERLRHAGRERYPAHFIQPHLENRLLAALDRHALMETQ